MHTLDYWETFIFIIFYCIVEKIKFICSKALMSLQEYKIKHFLTLLLARQISKRTDRQPEHGISAKYCRNTRRKTGEAPSDAHGVHTHVLCNINSYMYLCVCICHNEATIFCTFARGRIGGSLMRHKSIMATLRKHQLSHVLTTQISSTTTTTKTIYF